MKYFLVLFCFLVQIFTVQAVELNEKQRARLLLQLTEQRSKLIRESKELTAKSRDMRVLQKKLVKKLVEKKILRSEQTLLNVTSFERKQMAKAIDANEELKEIQQKSQALNKEINQELAKNPGIKQILDLLVP